MKKLPSCFRIISFSKILNFVSQDDYAFNLNQLLNGLHFNDLPYMCLFDLILKSQSTTFQLCWDRSSCVEPVLSND